MANLLLGINVDHVATLRQVRNARYPDPVFAAHEAILGGADSITVHLREDRRHIQLRDVEILRTTLPVPLNLEMAVAEDMLTIAERIKPQKCCLVPEKRSELTTEGGLDVVAQTQRINAAVTRLKAAGCEVSLFIEANPEQINAAHSVGADAIEIHTGHYAEATTGRSQQLAKIVRAAEEAHRLGLLVNMGHGLDYHNIAAIVAIPNCHELNIGHAIVARAIYVGMRQAVAEMRALLKSCSCSC